MTPGQAFFESLRQREHALVMGVLNVTPDSFSDGGRFVDPGAATAHAHALYAAGAAIIDVGGESTRPGAAPVSPAEELERVLPVIERLGDLPVSVDTRHALVARRAVEAGAGLVNDVSAGSDPDLFPAVAELGAGVVCMHMRGDPATMQETPRYDDVVATVEACLLERAEAAIGAGVPRTRVLLDPGIGFGKTVQHNLALLRALPRLAAHGYPILVGVSRKSVLGAITERPTNERLAASVAAAALSAWLGAAVVRAHDVAETRDAVLIAEAMKSR